MPEWLAVADLIRVGVILLIFVVLPIPMALWLHRRQARGRSDV